MHICFGSDRGPAEREEVEKDEKQDRVGEANERENRVKAVPVWRECLGRNKGG